MEDDKERILEHYAEHWSDFYAQYIPSIREHGQEAVGNCPLCPGDTGGHFYASIQTGQFHCKKCNESGDAFTFYAQMKGLNEQTEFPEILSGMAEDAGITTGAGVSQARRKPARATGNAPAKKPAGQGAGTRFYLTDVQEIGEATAEWFRGQGRVFSLETWQRWAKQAVYHPGKQKCIAFPQQSGGYHVWLRDVKGEEARWRFADEGKADLVGQIEGDRVYITEGEWDLLAAWERGERSVITSTTGASTWKKKGERGWAECFRGKEVDVCYDADKAGRDGQADVARDLQSMAKSIRLVQWPEGVKPGYDLRDWLTEGHSMEELTFVAWRPENLPLVEGGRTLLLQEIPPMEWIVKDMVPKQGVMLLAGRPKLGKSWLALQLAKCVCGGADFLWHNTEKGMVLYLALEDGRRRIQARLKQQGWTEEDAALAFFAYELPGLDKAGVDILARLIDQTDPALIVLDALAKVLPPGVKENLAEDMAGVLYPLSDLANKAERCILLVHHHRKGAGKEGTSTGEDIRGSSAIYAAADGVISLYREGKASEARLSVQGRDIEESEMAIGWTGCGWAHIGGVEVLGQRDKKRKVIDAFQQLREGTAKEIAEEAKVSQQWTKIVLEEIVKDGNATRSEKNTGGRKAVLYVWNT